MLLSVCVRRAGCGGLLVSTDDVRRRWCWSTALLCATTAFTAFFSSTFSRHCPEIIWRISLKSQFFYPFFLLGTLSWIMVRIGKVGREVVKKAWLSVIIKLKLAWLSRSMILPLGTFPWLSLSVIHAKTRPKIPKRLDFDNTINLSNLIVSLGTRTVEKKIF